MSGNNNMYLLIFELNVYISAHISTNFTDLYEYIDPVAGNLLDGE